MSEKSRQPFTVETQIGTVVAFGVIYEQGNTQLHWRRSVGWTAEQYHSVGQLFGVEARATVIRYVDKLPPRKWTHQETLRRAIQQKPFNTSDAPHVEPAVELSMLDITRRQTKEQSDETDIT